MESAIKYARRTQRKQFSIKMRQTWSMQTGHGFSCSRICFYCCWCDPCYRSNPLDRSSKFGFFTFGVICRHRTQFLAPKNLVYKVPTPFTWFFSSRTFVWALDPIQTSCTIAMALTSWPSVFRLNVTDTWPSMPRLFPFLPFHFRSSFYAEKKYSRLLERVYTWELRDCHRHAIGHLIIILAIFHNACVHVSFYLLIPTIVLS